MELETQVNESTIVPFHKLVSNARKGQFGNTLCYYTRKHYDTWNDPRVTALPSNIVNDMSILYVGAHNGTIPIQMAIKFQPKLIEAIDIDSKLLNQGADLCKLVDQFSTREDIESLKVINDLGASCEDPFVKVHRLVKEMKLNQKLSQRILFRAMNILDPCDAYKNKRYDTIFCLNVTKYIHLNFGEGGLHSLFHNIFELLNVGGFFVLQAQSTKSYQKFKSFAPILAENYKNILTKPENFQAFLTTHFSYRLIYNVEVDLSKNKNKPPKTILIFGKFDTKTRL